jgi:hypothetical protein
MIAVNIASMKVRARAREGGRHGCPKFLSAPGRFRIK